MIVLVASSNACKMRSVHNRIIFFVKVRQPLNLNDAFSSKNRRSYQHYIKHLFSCQEAKRVMCKNMHINFAAMICPDCVKTHCDRFVNSIPFFEAV